MTQAIDKNGLVRAADVVRVFREAGLLSRDASYAQGAVRDFVDAIRALPQPQAHEAEPSLGSREQTVPVEPTETMIEAGQAIPFNQVAGPWCREVYRAMLAAAPSPPRTEEGGSRDQVLEEAALPDRETLGRMIYDAGYAHEGSRWELNETKEVWFEWADRLTAALKGRAPASPLPAHEPVADYSAAAAAAWDFVRPKLLDMYREKGAAGVWSTGFRSGWDAQERATPPTRNGPHAEGVEAAARRLEQACEALASTRSQETYLRMIDADKAGDALRELDAARADVRKLLSPKEHG